MSGETTTTPTAPPACEHGTVGCTGRGDKHACNKTGTQVAHEMLRLRRMCDQSDFVQAFMAVMSLEPDGVHVRMNLTWPRPKAAPKATKKTPVKARRSA